MYRRTALAIRGSLESAPKGAATPGDGDRVDEIDELDMREAQLRMKLYDEYRDAARVFKYYVETELRAYLANDVVVEPVAAAGGAYFKVTLTDVWIYEAERLNRFVPEVIVYSVNDVHVQRLKGDDE